MKNDSSQEIPVRHYDRVAEELQKGTRAQGLWAKAYADALGDETVTKALYIRYRAAHHAEAERLEAEQKAKVEAEEQALKDREILDQRLKQEQVERKQQEKAADAIRNQRTESFGWIFVPLVIIFILIIIIIANPSH